MYLIVSCSLNPISKSRILAERALQHFLDRGCEAEIVDMRDWPLPPCDGNGTGTDSLAPLAKKIADADAILLAVPIYNYDVNAVCRGLAEVTGRSWNDKIVGFLCAAGGKGSYMAPVGMANSLFLHYHCLIVPRFVYATGDQFSDDGVSDDELAERIDLLVDRTVTIATRLSRPDDAHHSRLD